MSHVWELYYKETWAWRIDAFELWCWRRLLRVPWTARRSNQSILKEISTEYSLEGLMLKLKLQSIILARLKPKQTHFTLNCCCSVAQSDALPPHGLQHARLPCPSPTLGACSNSCPLSQWCHPTISSFVIPFSSCLQSLPAPGSFTVRHLFTSGGQSTGASALVLPMIIQDKFPLEVTGWISLQSKGLSKVFSSTIVQKHQFFGTQLSSQFQL